MTGTTKAHIKGFATGAAVEANRIVKIGAADGTVIKGAAATDALLGVSDVVDTPSGGICDVIMGGVAEVKLGGTVARGARVTSDASGQGVAASPSAGTNNGVVGIALSSGVSGDLVPVAVMPHSLQG